MTLRQVTDRVHVETGHLGSNNSVIVTDDGLILIDAPHKPTDAIRWAETVGRLGEVRYLVNTDHHPDHTIGNFWLPGVVVSHAGTRRRLEHEAPSEDYLLQLMARIDPGAVPLLAGYAVRLPAVVFSEAMTIHLGGVTLELTYRPGHTANSLLAYCPEERVVFTGDNVCEAGLPSFQDSTLPNWFAALDAVDAIDFEVLVPGHGEAGDRATVDRYRRWGRGLVAEVAAALRSGESRDDACDRIRFPDNIHVSTPEYVGYPDDLIDVFQRRSVARVYDDLLADPSLVQR